MGSDHAHEDRQHPGAISIHAPRMGSDLVACLRVPFVDISIHAPRMGSDQGHALRFREYLISIHAPRMGSDLGSRTMEVRTLDFNPRSPDGERRAWPPRPCSRRPFQSTLPGWGATTSTPMMPLDKLFQSTLPGWGATPIVARDVAHVQFQSTLPGWGATRHIATAERNIMLFQSTLPGWGATPSSQTTAVVFHVFQSTLPGWGATLVRPVSGLLTVDFNPRSPDGERRQTVGRLGLIHGISIHAPRMGSDAHGNCRSDRGDYFNPRSPDGERRCRRLSDARCSYFNPRSPDGERPLFLSRSDSMGIFQSTLPGWGATQAFV